MAPTEPEAPLEAPLLNEAENAEPPMPKGFWKRELRAIFALAAPCIVTTCSSQVGMCGALVGNARGRTVGALSPGAPRKDLGSQACPAAPMNCVAYMGFFDALVDGGGQVWARRPYSTCNRNLVERTGRVQALSRLPNVHNNTVPALSTRSLGCVDL